MIDQNFLAFLVRRAQNFLDHWGTLDDLIEQSDDNGIVACGCMGPIFPDDPFCNCIMRDHLNANLPIVLETIGYKEQALQLMRKRLVRALGG